MSLLYALARGYALVHGRRQLTGADIPIVARAALESTPNDRRAVMRLLLTGEGAAATSDVQKALNCSAPTARAILETLEKLGLGEFVNPGPPAVGTLTLAASLCWLLEPEPKPRIENGEQRRRIKAEVDRAARERIAAGPKGES
jgi:hypothetical protein